MSKPIENCPVEEKPMRDRAWTAEQVEAMAAEIIGGDLSYGKRNEGADMLDAYAATLRQQAALAQNAQPKTLGDFVRLPDADREAIGLKVAERATEMQKEVIARAQAQRAQDAQGEAEAWQRRIKHDGYKWFKWENFNSVVDYESPADFPKMVGRWECEYRPLYLHAERARVPAGWRETILAVIDALDKATGDSDPNIDPDMTDKEVRDEYPEVWSMQQLTAMLAAPPQPEGE